MDLLDLGRATDQKLPEPLEVAHDVLLLRVELNVDAADVEALHDEGDEEGQGDDGEGGDEGDVQDGAQHPPVLRPPEVVPLSHAEVEQRGGCGREGLVLGQVGSEEEQAAAGKSEEQDEGDEGVVHDAVLGDHERLQQDAEVAIEAENLKHLQDHQHEDQRF